MKKSNVTIIITILLILALVAAGLIFGMGYVPRPSNPTITQTGKLEIVEFKIKAPDATSVFVAGSFNNWKVDQYPLQRNDQGIWEGTVLIAPGRYEYKFLVDGDWVHDKNNPTKVHVPAPFWGVNSVIDVKSSGAE
jgi:1,4-alpha-glucan branching enzyme